MNNRFAGCGSLSLLMGISIVSLGCERKETLLDIETPGRDIEVERSLDDGSIDVEVDRK